MDINRGNRFDFLVSISSNHRGLERYAAEQFADADPRRHEAYKLGDVNSTLIRTVKGQTIYLSHNTNNARPYSRINVVQGTKGIVQGWPDRIYVEGRSPEDEWETLDRYYADFEHPLWKSERVQHATGGHGGMDFLEDWRLIECLRGGLPTDQNVYDAAASDTLLSGEETAELPSPFKPRCRLLFEKKKKRLKSSDPLKSYALFCFLKKKMTNHYKR